MAASLTHCLPNQIAGKTGNILISCLIYSDHIVGRSGIPVRQFLMQFVKTAIQSAILRRAVGRRHDGGDNRLFTSLVPAKG